MLLYIYEENLYNFALILRDRYEMRCGSCLGIYLDGVKRLPSWRLMGESAGETFDSLLLLFNGSGGEERLELFLR